MAGDNLTEDTLRSKHYLHCPVCCCCQFRQDLARMEIRFVPFRDRAGGVGGPKPKLPVPRKKSRTQAKTEAQIKNPENVSKGGAQEAQGEAIRNWTLTFSRKAGKCARG